MTYVQCVSFYHRRQKWRKTRITDSKIYICAENTSNCRVFMDQNVLSWQTHHIKSQYVTIYFYHWLWSEEFIIFHSVATPQLINVLLYWNYLPHWMQSAFKIYHNHCFILCLLILADLTFPNLIEWMCRNYDKKRKEKKRESSKRVDFLNTGEVGRFDKQSIYFGCVPHHIVITNLKEFC